MLSDELITDGSLSGPLIDLSGLHRGEGAHRKHRVQERGDEPDPTREPASPPSERTQPTNER